MRHDFTGRSLQHVRGFFSSLLVVLGLMSRSLRGPAGRDLAVRLSAILPPGSWQLISDSLLRPEVNPWAWVLFGWVGTLLVGSQVTKLITEGIRLTYGDRERHSFLGRQLRGLLLFGVSVVAWLVAAALSLFERPLRQWVTGDLAPSVLARAVWTVILGVLGVILTMLVLALVYRIARPVATTWRSILPGAAASAILWWGVNLLFGIYVRKIQYGPVYGGLAAAIGLMVWMEFSAMLVFLGAAWNAECAVRPNPKICSHARQSASL